jgi:hypothetical protein
MGPGRRQLLALLVAGLGFCSPGGASAGEAEGPAGRLDTLQQLLAYLGHCWRSPVLPTGHAGLQITVLVSFRRDGQILGQPRITFESEGATDEDRLIYRQAVMETLQRCTPLPLSVGLGGAIAGRPVALRFDDRRRPSKPKERDV